MMTRLKQFRCLLTDGPPVGNVSGVLVQHYKLRGKCGSGLLASYKLQNQADLAVFLPEIWQEFLILYINNINNIN